jgi:hypothetical protein
MDAIPRKVILKEQMLGCSLEKPDSSESDLQFISKKSRRISMSL